MFIDQCEEAFALRQEGHVDTVLRSASAPVRRRFEARPRILTADIALLAESESASCDGSINMALLAERESASCDGSINMALLAEGESASCYGSINMALLAEGDGLTGATEHRPRDVLVARARAKGAVSAK
jgi:hypothetical protein